MPTIGRKDWQGYPEGDFVCVSPPAGRLDRLAVAKGSRVAGGAPLLEPEHAAGTAAHRNAAHES